MAKVFAHIVDILHNPGFSARFHAAAALFWLLPGSVISYLLRDSIAFLVFLSVYAIVAAHWSAYQASRAEAAGKGG